MKKDPHAEAGIARTLRGDAFNPESKLTLVREKARKNPSLSFSNLTHHLTPELIESSLLKMDKNTSAGIDQMKVAYARKHHDWILPKVMTEIHTGKYKPPAVRRVYIPKSNGDKRPLGVPTVIDRAVQASTVKILEQIYEEDFLKCSFGFRPKLSCHNAVATVGGWIKVYKLNHVLEVDLRDFFGSINHGWLMKFLRLRISDERILKLIEGWLKAGVMEDGKWRISDMGNPHVRFCGGAAPPKGGGLPDDTCDLGRDNPA